MERFIPSGLNPFTRGTLAGLGNVAMIALFVFAALYWLPYPTVSLLRDIFNFGIVMVLGYAVEAAWLAQRMKGASDYRELLGTITTFGLAGLSGVACLMLITAHRDANHGNLLDDIGLAWAVGSVGVLSVLVVLHPLLVDAWETEHRSK
jgi:hypothetical protein